MIPDVYLFGDITTDSVTVAVEKLLTLPLGDRHIWIGSTGGDIDAAIILASAIDLIRRNGYTVTTHAAGVANSCAVFIFQLGDHRTISPHTSMLIHKVFLEPDEGGEWEQGDLTAQLQGVVNSTNFFFQTLAERSGQSFDFIRHQVQNNHGQWFLSASEIIAFNLADEVIPFAPYIKNENHTSNDVGAESTSSPVVSLSSRTTRPRTRKRRQAS